MPTRISRDPSVRVLKFLIAAAFVLIGWWFEPYLPKNETARHPPRTLNQGEYEVLRVVDGDTLILKKDRLRVRLQGVDTPETVKDFTPVEKWGPEATAYTKQFVQAARNRVLLTIDGEGVDRYGRYLAFVWHEGRLLNEELIAAGLARAKLGYDYGQPMKNRFKAAEDKARREQLGIWKR